MCDVCCVFYINNAKVVDIFHKKKWKNAKKTQKNTKKREISWNFVKFEGFLGFFGPDPSGLQF